MPGRGFLFSGKQESRLAGSQVGKELGPVRAAHARQEAAAAWMDTRGDAVAAPTPSAPPAVQSGTGERLEGRRGRVLQHKGSALAGGKLLPQGPGWHKAASAAGRGQLLAGCTLSGSSNLL